MCLKLAPHIYLSRVGRSIANVHACEASPGSIGKKDGPGLLSHITQQHAGLEAVGRAQHVLMATMGQRSVVIPLQLPQRHLRKAGQQIVLLGCQGDGRHVCQAAAAHLIWEFFSFKTYKLAFLLSLLKACLSLKGEAQQCGRASQNWNASTTSQNA